MRNKDPPLLCNCIKKRAIAKKRIGTVKKGSGTVKKGSGTVKKKKKIWSVKKEIVPVDIETYTKHNMDKDVSEYSTEYSHEIHLTDYQPIPNLNPTINYIVNLGCLSPPQYFTDIVPVNIKWPNNQIPRNYATGASGPNYSSVNGGIAGPEINLANGGQPSINTSHNIPNTLGNNSISTSFQSTVYLTSNVDMYNVSAVANGFSNITLSGEGLLWTLWPLTKKKGTASFNGLETYFDQFTFGTSLKSRYPIGQMGFFINNMQLGCTPFGAGSWRDFEELNSPLPNQPVNTGDPLPKETEEFIPIVGQPGLAGEEVEPGFKPGVQSFEETLLIDLKQHVSIIVVKVSEEIARIFNPSAGISSPERYIYVGYDAWSIFRITSNPVGPMAAQTYISPQSVTGSVTGENLQVVVPPNFPQTIYYKNTHYFGHSQGVD